MIHNIRNPTHLLKLLREEVKEEEPVVAMQVRGATFQFTQAELQQFLHQIGDNKNEQDSAA